MADPPAAVNTLVTALLPSLSRSLAEQFIVFREQLPPAGYRVAQEVMTAGEVGAVDAASADIADIVIENFGTSDGHGHDYWRYLAHGTDGGRPTAVVLLCLRRVPHLQRDGWEEAVVVTYAELLRALRAHIDADRRWRRNHPDQHSLIRQLDEHFVEGPAAVNLEDTITFLTTMCETGESARYGHRPRDVAEQEFADLVAEHARRQLIDSRTVLATTKRSLRAYGRSTLTDSVNAAIPEGAIERVITRIVGQWEWTVELQRTDSHSTVFLEFGPTAVVELQRIPHTATDPDFSCLFISLQAESGSDNSAISQTDVRTAEVIEGLAPDDTRLQDAVLRIAAGT